MNSCMKTPLIVFLFCFSIISRLPAQDTARPEFRGVWIASVDNIDWPSKKTLTPDSQPAEYIRLLDMDQRNGMNAVVVQVRPATDAFYPSPYEPWSEWLTGRQGLPPAPYYDPLQFMIDEAHKRGMEFHAWCNPYRAEFTVGKSSISPTHITRLHPEWNSMRSEEHTSELQSHSDLVCRLLLEKKKKAKKNARLINNGTDAENERPHTEKRLLIQTNASADKGTGKKE